MMRRVHIARTSTVALLSILLAACATHYRAGDDLGVYREVPSYRTTHVGYVDPLLYPYWSLDYFYYSRYYHPYSVVVHRFDPWYYPYPGWYYGFGHGRGFAGYGGHRAYYPWYRHPGYYRNYRPWRTGVHLSFGYRVPVGGDHYDHRVRQLDERLRTLETRRSLANRSRRPARQLEPGATPALPTTGRSAAVRRDALRTRTMSERAAIGRNRSAAADRQQALLERLRAAERRSALPERDIERRRPTRPADRTGDAPREILVQPRRDSSPSQRTAEPQMPQRRSSPPPTRRPTSPPPQRRTTPTRSPSRESSRPPRSMPKSRNSTSAQQRARERKR